METSPRETGMRKAAKLKAMQTLGQAPDYIDIGARRPIAPDILNPGADIDVMSISADPDLVYDQPQVANIAFQVSPAGAVAATKMKFNKLHIDIPAPFTTDEYDMDFADFISDLGGAAIRKRTELQAELWLGIDKAFLSAVNLIVPDGSTYVGDNLELDEGGTHASHIVVVDESVGCVEYDDLLHTAHLLKHIGSEKPKHISPVKAILMEDPGDLDAQTWGTKIYSESTAEEFYTNGITGKMLDSGRGSKLGIILQDLTKVDTVSATTPERHTVFGKNVGEIRWITRNGGQRTVIDAVEWGTGGFYKRCKIKASCWVLLVIFNRYGIAQLRLTKRNTKWV
jgi:hypothetical protein